MPPCAAPGVLAVADWLDGVGDAEIPPIVAVGVVTVPVSDAGDGVADPASVRVGAVAVAVPDAGEGAAVREPAIVGAETADVCDAGVGEAVTAVGP